MTKPVAGLTAKEIIKFATPAVKQASKYVKISKVTPGILKNKSHKITAEAYSIATPDGVPKQRREKYKCVVYGINPDARLNKDQVKVSCTCAFFCYTCEYALKRKGAADIIHSNGEAPVEKNPKLIPTPCKHLYRVLVEMVKAKV